MILEFVQSDYKHKWKLASITAGLIRWAQKTNYSHYAMRIMCPVSGQWVYFDSRLRGVSFESEKEFKKRYTIRKTHRVHLDSTINKFFGWAQAFLGRKYSILQLVGLLIIILKLGKRNRFANGSDCFVCTELCLEALKEFAGLELETTENHDLVQTYYEITKIENAQKVK